MELKAAEPLQVTARALSQVFVTVNVRQQLAQTAQDIPQKNLIPLYDLGKR